MLQGMSLHIEQLQNENNSLRQELADAKSDHRSLVRQRNHYQREFEDCLCANRGLAKQSATLQAQITEMKRDIEGTISHAKQSIKERDERINALRKLNAEHEGKIAALESALRDKEALLKLIPESVLTTAKLKRLASLGK